jgi:AraC-like DNA-binding protein
MGFLLFTGYKILVTPKLLKSDSGGFILPESKKTDQLSIRLQEILSEKKLYLNPNLSRKDLAEELGVNEVFVSSLLNEALQTSFYELINKYRVEEAIHLIQSGRLENITVEALAKEAGFNSKSTFNKIFKQETGTTPTRYRDQL